MELNGKVYPSISRIMEMTAFKTEEKAKGALAALKWFDEGAPHKFNGLEVPVFFNMRTYISPDYNAEKCGTACCMAGAITLHALPDMAGSDHGSGSLQTYFGFDARNQDHPLTKLFYPLRRDSIFIIEEKTPEQAAETLRNYLFSGKVEWK